MSDDAPTPSLLPVNSSALERALDIGFARLLERIDPPFPELMNPTATPVAFLPYLAADRGVNEWSTAAPEAEKRLTVELAWPTARQAGTRKALENAAKGLQLIPEIRAWHEQIPVGPPYSFPSGLLPNSLTAKKSTPVSTGVWPTPRASATP